MKQRKSGCLSGCLIFFIIIIIAIVASTIYAFNNGDELGETPKGALSKDINVSVEEAENILNILKKCGIDEIESIKTDKVANEYYGDGSKNYVFDTKNIHDIKLVLNKDNTVNRVKYNTSTLYENGKQQNEISNFSISNKEKTEYQIKCQEYVNGILESPSTAKFPNISHWKFAKNNGEIIVQSYVDAQNSFGAEVRNEFQLTIKNNIVTSFIFEGKEFIK